MYYRRSFLIDRKAAEVDQAIASIMRKENEIYRGLDKPFIGERVVDGFVVRRSDWPYNLGNPIIFMALKKCDLGTVVTVSMRPRIVAIIAVVVVPLIVLVDYLIRSMHQNMSDSASHVPLAVFLMMWFMLLIGFVPQVFIVMNVIKKEVVERLGAGPSRVDS